jgi:LPS export ABC transporter protein LptC
MIKHLSFIIISLFIAGCGSSNFFSKDVPKQPEIALEIKGFEAYVTNDGVPQYILKAESAKLREKTNCVIMDRINLTFIKEGDEKTSSTLVADSGVYYFRDNAKLKKKQSDVDLKGNIVFDLSNGTMLKTPELHYESSSEKIFSNAGFEKRMVGKEQIIIITGKSFVTDKNLLNWEDVGANLTMQPLPDSMSKKKDKE